MIRASVFALALLAAACGQATDRATQHRGEREPSRCKPRHRKRPRKQPPQDACGASRFQHLIGTLASEIDQATLPAGTRVLTPDVHRDARFPARSP